MLKRMRGMLAEFFRQADLVLLGLCCAATLFGIVLIFSATRYLGSNRNVLVQSVALLLECMEKDAEARHVVVPFTIYQRESIRNISE